MRSGALPEPSKLTEAWEQPEAAAQQLQGDLCWTLSLAA